MAINEPYSSDDALRKGKWHRDRLKSGVGNYNMAESWANTSRLMVQERAQKNIEENSLRPEADYAFR